MQEFFYAHPRGWANPVTLRADDTLPAAGAWETGAATNIWTATGVTLAFTYERGAAGGAFDWQIEVSLYSVAALVPAGASEWVTESIYSAGAVVLGADTQSDAQRDYHTYKSTGAGDEDFSYELELPTPIERIRIRVRESALGVQGSPGDLNVIMIVRG
jgi:hypothetical protein